MRWMAIILFGIFMLGTLVNAETLKCASKKGEHIYYGDDGQIFLQAEILAPDKLNNVSMEHRPDTKYSSREPGLAPGAPSPNGNFMRFILYGDAWCNYRISVPRDFRARVSFPLFLDAFCEANTRSSHRLNCKRLP